MAASPPAQHKAETKDIDRNSPIPKEYVNGKKGGTMAEIAAWNI